MSPPRSQVDSTRLGVFHITTSRLGSDLSDPRTKYSSQLRLPSTRSPPGYLVPSLGPPFVAPGRVEGRTPEGMVGCLGADAGPSSLQVSPRRSRRPGRVSLSRRVPPSFRPSLVSPVRVVLGP